MALRKIVTKEDPILRKVCKPVEVFDEKLARLIDDMMQTLKKAQGVGLAAPQVGFLKRIFIMDLGDEMIECVNPEIIKTGGKQRVVEGCLSCPNDWGYVTRPNKCKLRAQNRLYRINIICLIKKTPNHCPRLMILTNLRLFLNHGTGYYPT